MPAVAVKESALPPPPTENEHPEREKKKSGGGDDFGGLDPFIVGLLRTLPEPGAEWDVAGRVKWLTTAANIFDLTYEGDGGIVVGPARAERSPRHMEN